MDQDEAAGGWMPREGILEGVSLGPFAFFVAQQYEVRGSLWKPPRGFDNGQRQTIQPQPRALRNKRRGARRSSPGPHAARWNAIRETMK